MIDNNFELFIYILHIYTINYIFIYFKIKEYKGINITPIKYSVCINLLYEFICFISKNSYIIYFKLIFI